MGDWMCLGLAANIKLSWKHVLWRICDVNMSLSVDISSYNSFRAWDHNPVLIPRAWSRLMTQQGGGMHISQTPSDCLLTFTAKDHGHDTYSTASLVGRTPLGSCSLKPPSVPDNLCYSRGRSGDNLKLPKLQTLILDPISLGENRKGLFSYHQ